MKIQLVGMALGKEMGVACWEVIGYHTKKPYHFSFQRYRYYMKHVFSAHPVLSSPEASACEGRCIVYRAAQHWIQWGDSSWSEWSKQTYTCYQWNIRGCMYFRGGKHTTHWTLSTSTKLFANIASQITKSSGKPFYGSYLTNAKNQKFGVLERWNRNILQMVLAEWDRDHTCSLVSPSPLKS